MPIDNAIEAIKNEIASHEAAVAKLKKALVALSGAEPAKKKRRKMSAATRAKMRAAQKARWAKKKSKK